jgi:hypothetical protein
VQKLTVQNGSSCFLSQSSEQRKVLADFLTNESNKKKWLKFARYKYFVKSEFSNPGPLEPEDYYCNVREIMLRCVTVIDTSVDEPRFKFTHNDKTYIMSYKRLYKYFLCLLKWEISHAFRSELKTCRLPHWDEDDQGEPPSEDDILLCHHTPGNAYIVQFNDPFDDKKIYYSKKVIEECIDTLEKENHLYVLILEELLNNAPNRVIAKKYKLCVRKVENIRKIINRRILHCHHNPHKGIKKMHKKT